jgi:hypothetical protein
MHEKRMRRRQHALRGLGGVEERPQGFLEEKIEKIKSNVSSEGEDRLMMSRYDLQDV